MKQYIDAGNSSFFSDVHSEIYVDKTGLLEVLNHSLGTSRRCFAVSRPRRFGKSVAAGMIKAYYSCGCDSYELFSSFAIAKSPGFENDLTSFYRKDDVLTALIHMGYLGYDPDSGEAFIPNEEVRSVFESAIRIGDWSEIRYALDHSDAPIIRSFVSCRQERGLRISPSFRKQA
ncbi:MAG TPA: hypothetical protein DCW47_07990 [Lachnospiraceae bacterium]|nr:hypothetical protein [Lachnospiraceae bacterium]